MTINFTELKIKQDPAGNQGLNVSLIENVPSLPTPVTQEAVNIEYGSLTTPQKAVVDSFIDLLKSKL
jgi:hypothetical protein